MAGIFKKLGIIFAREENPKKSNAAFTLLIFDGILPGKKKSALLTHHEPFYFSSPFFFNPLRPNVYVLLIKSLVKSETHKMSRRNSNYFTKKSFSIFPKSFFSLVEHFLASSANPDTIKTNCKSCTNFPVFVIVTPVKREVITGGRGDYWQLSDFQERFYI